MNDAEFDRLLRDALLEAVRQDWTPVLEGNPPMPPALSARYRRTRAKLLADPFGYVKRKIRPLWNKVLRTAACLLLAAGVAFGGVMAFSPEARAWVVRIITERRETHTRYSFTREQNQSSGLGVWRPQYLPDGFIQVDSVQMEHTASVLYEDPNGAYLELNYMFTYENTGFSLDSEHSSRSLVAIGDETGELYTSSESGWPSFLVWSDNASEIMYCLTSTVDAQELVLIAQSVQEIP